MSEVVIVAVVGALGSVAGSLFGVLASSKLTIYRIEQLEKKVDAHNNLIERTYKLEKQQAILEQHVEDLHKNDR